MNRFAKLEKGCGGRGDAYNRRRHVVHVLHSVHHHDVDLFCCVMKEKKTEIKRKRRKRCSMKNGCKMKIKLERAKAKY